MLKSVLVFASIFFSLNSFASTVRECSYTRGRTVFTTVTNQLSLSQAQRTAAAACNKSGAGCASRGCREISVARQLRAGTVTNSSSIPLAAWRQAQREDAASNAARRSASRTPAETADEIRRDKIDRRAGNISGGGSYTDLAGVTHYTDGTSSYRDAAGAIQFSDGTYANPGEIYTDLAGNVHYGKKVCYTDMAHNTSCHSE